MVGVPSVEIFLMDPNQYLREFSEKTMENSLRLGSDKRNRGMNLAPPVNQFLSADTGGAKDVQFDIHDLPGFEPGTSGVAISSPSH